MKNPGVVEGRHVSAADVVRMMALNAEDALRRVLDGP
jgi:hypothetical protein